MTYNKTFDVDLCMKKAMQEFLNNCRLPTELIFGTNYETYYGNLSIGRAFLGKFPREIP